MNRNKIKLYMLLSVMLFVFGGMSIDARAATTKNAHDVKALKKIISEKRKSGGKVSTNLDNKKQYGWSRETGRLTRIIWNRKEIRGKVDVSSFKGLKKLYIDGNKITRIKLGKLEMLEDLEVINNRLKRINLTKVKNLKFFICDKNNIRRLNLKNNKKLRILGCDHNKLKKLNLKGLKRLKMLSCRYNRLTELDASSCDLQWGLSCGHNQLKTIKFKPNSVLDFLYCENNQLTQLNLETVLSIQDIKCQKNRIERIDFTEVDQMSLYEITCDKNVEIIGLEEKNKKTIKKGFAFYEIEAFL